MGTSTRYDYIESAPKDRRRGLDEGGCYSDTIDGQRALKVPARMLEPTETRSARKR